MDDLIDRQQAIDAIKTSRFLVDALGKISKLPSAERKGHWETYLKEGLKYKCSVCGSRYNLAWTYCPRCGARMESER